MELYQLGQLAYNSNQAKDPYHCTSLMPSFFLLVTSPVPVVVRNVVNNCNKTSQYQVSSLLSQVFEWLFEWLVIQSFDHKVSRSPNWRTSWSPLSDGYYTPEVHIPHVILTPWGCLDFNGLEIEFTALYIISY